MTTSDNGMSDEIRVELNPTGSEPDRGPQPNPIPDRPADGAPKLAWVDYVVALGADRTFVSEETVHSDGDRQVEEPALSRPQLIKLADRLGG